MAQSNPEKFVFYSCPLEDLLIASYFNHQLNKESKMIEAQSDNGQDILNYSMGNKTFNQNINTLSDITIPPPPPQNPTHGKGSSLLETFLNDINQLIKHKVYKMNHRKKSHDELQLEDLEVDEEETQQTQNLPPIGIDPTDTHHIGYMGSEHFSILNKFLDKSTTNLSAEDDDDDDDNLQQDMEGQEDIGDPLHIQIDNARLFEPSNTNSSTKRISDEVGSDELNRHSPKKKEKKQKQKNVTSK
jgi:hypothetical protein